MYNISEDLRERFENGERKCARITLSNASYDDSNPLIITEADILAGGFSIDRYCATGSKIEIGSAVSAELSLALNNVNKRFDNIVFEGSILKVKIGIKDVEDSYIPCGCFTVDEPPRAFSTIKLKALDFMMRFDKIIDFSKLGSNHTVKTLVEKCAELCLVNISPNLNISKLPNADKSVAIPSTASTYRQLLQWAAQLTGTCAYIDWNGELMLSWFVDTPVTITSAHRYSGDVLENDIEITGVTIKNENATVTEGSEKYPLVIEGNGLVIDDEDTKVKNIANVVNGFKYRPYECSCVAMPYLYPLDRIVYTDKNGNKISTVITNHTFGLNDTSSLAAQGETAAKNSYAQQVGLTKAEVENAIAEAIKKVNHNTEYFYVRYSAYANGKNNGVTSMTDKITADTVYLGTCATNSANAPEDADSYDWMKIRPEDGHTPEITISSDGYWVIDNEKTTVKAQGENGKTPTITVGANGNWFVDGKDTNTKAQGAQGKDGADIEYVYYLSSDGETPAKPSYSGTTLSRGWTPSPQGISSTNKYEFVSVRTKPAGSSTWGEFSAPVIWSSWGEKGTDGDGVEYKYYLCDSSDAPTYTAGDSRWTDNPSGVSADKMYEYVVQIKHYGDGTDDKISDVALWAKWGETGDNGVSVTEVITEYYKSTSDQTPPATNSSGWTTNAPLWEEGYYLWTRLKTTLSDDSVMYSDPTVDASWKKVTVVEETSKELNEVLANALGLTVTEQSGVRYYHSNPSLSASGVGDTIIVFNASGFGVCKSGWNDGNPQFTYGATFDGKAVWDILVANKISADLIEAGVLSSRNTSSLQTSLDLATGILRFIFPEGQVTAKGFTPGGESDLTEEQNEELKWLSLNRFPGVHMDMNMPDRNVCAYYTPAGVMIGEVSAVEAIASYAVNYFKYECGNGAMPIPPPDFLVSEIGADYISTKEVRSSNLIYLSNAGKEKKVKDLDSLVSNLSIECENLSTSLSALQQKYTELLEEIGKVCEHSGTITRQENAVAATCTSQGSYDEVVYCSACGDELSRTKRYTPIISHSYSSVVEKWPDCTNSGTRRYTCSECGTSYTEPISATEHKDNDGNGICDVCGIEVGTFYTTSVDVSPAGGGTVTGAGRYLNGSTATLTAKANSGYSFDGWYQGTTRISTSVTYSFNVIGATILTAKFVANEPTISEGVEAYMEFEEKQVFKHLRFEPQHEGTYVFESLDRVSADPDGMICDENKVKIGNCYDDKSGANGGFRVVYDGFEVGKVYYLAARLWSGTGTLKVKVTRDSTDATEYMTAQISAANAGANDTVCLAKDANGTELWNKAQFSEGDIIYFCAKANSGKVINRIEYTNALGTFEDSAQDLIDAKVLNEEKTELKLQFNVTAFWLNTEYSMTVYFEDSEPVQVEIIIDINLPERGNISIACNGRTIASSSGTYTFSTGDVVTLTATPVSGQSFQYWFEGVSPWTVLSRDNPYTFTVTTETPKKIRAGF